MNPHMHQRQSWHSLAQHPPVIASQPATAGKPAGHDVTLLLPATMSVPTDASLYSAGLANPRGFRPAWLRKPLITDSVPAQVGVAALVPDSGPRKLVMSTWKLVASALTSGMPRPVEFQYFCAGSVAEDRYLDTTDSWYDGRCGRARRYQLTCTVLESKPRPRTANTVENPPPLSFQPLSGWPVAAIVVPPTAVTYGDEAGKVGENTGHSTQRESAQCQPRASQEVHTSA